MDLHSYKDFAENDYQYLKASLECGLFANSMAAMAQSISERYLKHIIDKGYEPETTSEEDAKSSILRTHSLHRLLNFIETRNIFELTDEEKMKIGIANGYYFETKYPGNDAIIITRSDIQRCMISVETSRDVVERFEQELLLMQSQSQSTQGDSSDEHTGFSDIYDDWEL